MQFASEHVERFNRTFSPPETAPKDGTLIAALIVLDGDFVTFAPSIYWDTKQCGWFAGRDFGPFQLHKWDKLAWYTEWMFDEMANAAGRH